MMSAEPMILSYIFKYITTYHNTLYMHKPFLIYVIRQTVTIPNIETDEKPIDADSNNNSFIRRELEREMQQLTDCSN